MKTPNIAIKLLTALVGLSFTAVTVAADEAREIEFRVLCLGFLDDVKAGEIASGESGKKLEVDLTVGRFSEQFKTSFSGDTVTLSIDDKKAPKGRRVVASGELSKSKRQVFLFVPDPAEDRSYRILAMDDDERSMPMGSVRVVNLSGSPIRVNLDGKGLDGEELKPIEDGQFESYPPVKDSDEWGMYQVALEMGLPDGEWFPFMSPSWKRSELKRDLVVITFDERVQQPNVHSYKDIPPWRRAELGDD